jgi:hypothetical protein
MKAASPYRPSDLYLGHLRGRGGELSREKEDHQRG